MFTEGIVHTVPEAVAREVTEHLNARAVNHAPLAQWQLGYSYAKKGDYHLAIPLYRQAADQGSAIGQTLLAACYLRKSRGIGQDVYEAARLFNLAAEQGLPAAQYMLGLLYASGRGVCRNDNIAKKWFLRAADQKFAYAQLRLARIHLHEMKLASKAKIKSHEVGLRVFMAVEQGTEHLQLELQRLDVVIETHYQDAERDIKLNYEQAKEYLNRVMGQTRVTQAIDAAQRVMSRLPKQFHDCRAVLGLHVARRTQLLQSVRQIFWPQRAP